ncbi:MAG TPA: LysR family transcriptional regulator [Erythrobacter sp.]|nr:LysR family transcriptional regulator [Erythrobacter sp.]
MASDSALSLSYRYFAAVAEAGSVRGASRGVNVAASAISRQLIQLEHVLGVQLFERHGRLMRLSPAGELLLKGLRATERSHEETLAELDALKGLARGSVRIATVESVSQAILPALVTQFTAAYPGVQLAITVAGSDAVSEMVRDHHADLGFTFNPTSREGLSVDYERKFQMGAIVAPGHQLAKRKSLTVAECLDHPVAWPARGLSLRVIVDRALGRRKQTAQHLVECNSLRLMASLAREGQCVAFQTRIGIEADLAAKRLVFIPLTDRALPPDRLMIVRRPALSKPSAAMVFLGIAKSHMQKLALD